MKDFKEQIVRPRKVALYAALDISNFYMVWEVHYSDHDEHWTKLPEGQLREESHKGYVRITEPVDLHFSPISDDTIVQNAVRSLDDAEREVLREMNTKIAALREQKKQLLAITHQQECDDAL